MPPRAPPVPRLRRSGSASPPLLPRSRAAHRFFHSGRRFSKNDAIPSRTSSVAISSPRNTRSASRRASSNGSPSSRRERRTFIRITSGLARRRSPSTCSSAADSPASGTTRETSPIVCISAAVYVRPVDVTSIARARPMRAGSSATPTGAKKPIRISGCPNVARSLARSTSAIITSSNPAPSAAPSTAITTGNSTEPSAANRRLNVAIISGASSGRCSPTSPPAENARAADCSTRALSERSACARSTPFASSPIIAALSTLTGGASSVRKATSSRTSYRTAPVIIVVFIVVLSDVLAAVDLDDLSRDVPRPIRQQERHDRRHLVRFTQPAECRLFHGALHHGRRQARRHFRADESRRHAVDVHAARSQFARERLGEADHSRLRRRVVRLAELAAHAVDRSDRDDAPAALSAKRGRRGATEGETTLQVHVEHRVPRRFRHLPRDGVARDAGVAHEAVELAERRHRLRHRMLGRREVGNVGPQRHGLAAERPQLLRAALGIVERTEVHERHVASLQRELARDCRADAASGTGDERRLPREVALHGVRHYPSLAPQPPQNANCFGMPFAPQLEHVWLYGPQRNSLLPFSSAAFLRNPMKSIFRFSTNACIPS